MKYIVWFSASAGILTNTFNPLPEGEINTEYTYLFFDKFSLSCNSSFCFVYPSKSKHINPECSIIEASVLLLNVPLKHIAGNCFFNSCLSGLRFSKRIFFTKSLVAPAPSFILSSITCTSRKNGVSVSLIFWNIVTLCTILCRFYVGLKYLTI